MPVTRFRRRVWSALLISLLPVLLAGVPSSILAQEEAAGSSTRDLLVRLQASDGIPGGGSQISPRSSESALDLGWISSVASGPEGLVYVLHRDLSQDPVVVLDRTGTRLDSWGSGLFVTPHSVRVDVAGNVWTVDSGTSRVLKFAPDGTELLRIDIELPQGPVGSFPRGATDVAFASDGHLFIADGYGNSRVVEYTSDGTYVGEWGTGGDGPGEFRIVHGIAVDHDDVVYVADRENGRIQVFTRTGKIIDVWKGVGKVYSVSVTQDSVWASTHPLDQSHGDFSGWLLKLGKRSGDVESHLPVPETHSFSVAEQGSVVTSVENRIIRWKLN